MTRPILCRQGLRLLPRDPNHDSQTVLWLNDPELREDFGLTYPVTLESHRRWLNSQKDHLMWAIVTAEGTYIGNLSVHLVPKHASAYLQIYIGDKTARGRGLGSIALSCALDYLFEVLNIHRVWLHLLPGKIAAARLYAKAGFVEEGIERDSVRRNDVFHHQFRLSLLASEWRGRAGSPPQDVP